MRLVIFSSTVDVFPLVKDTLVPFIVSEPPVEVISIPYVKLPTNISVLLYEFVVNINVPYDIPNITVNAIPKTKDVLFILLNIITPPQKIYLLVH